MSISGIFAFSQILSRAIILIDKAPKIKGLDCLRLTTRMSYQVLARKWRPQFFKDMVGQEHVMRALINALDNQRLHHAYLFTGTRGVGKTTIARILAKCLNCEQGISSEPCGECQSCLEISQGRFVDLIEVDAASRTKVEDTREILDNVQYAPTRGRFKVYLIDEVHMLSNSSFNALLKTLEEPPPHVKFLLATTDPQKLPATILSRCLQFSLKNMTPERIVGYLKNILGQEQITSEEPGLWLLGKAAEGSMRDALSLTDQAISFGNGAIKETEVASMLGTVDRGRVFQLAIALAENNAADVMAQVALMAEHAVDFNNLLADLLGLIHRIAIAQAVPDAVDNSQGDKEQVMALAGAISPSQVQLMYQIALTGKRDLPLAPDARSGMEMTLLRILNFSPITDQTGAAPAAGAAQGQGGTPAKKPDLAHLKGQLASGLAANTAEPVAAQVTAIAESPKPQAQVAVASEQVASEQVAAAPLQQVQASEPPPWNDEKASDAAIPQPNVRSFEQAHQAGAAEQSISQQAVPAYDEPLMHDAHAEPLNVAEPKAMYEVEQPQASAIEPAPVAVEEAPITIEKAIAVEAQPDHSELLAMPLSSQSWPMIFEALALDGMLRNLVANTCLMSVNGSELLFHGDAGHMRLFNTNHQQSFAQVLNQTLGQNYQLQVIEGPIQFETPAQRQQRLAAEKQQAAVQSIEQDVNVQALRQAFNAQVIMDSITPLA